MTRTTQDIDALHRAVNQMRTMRRNRETLKAWDGGEGRRQNLGGGGRGFRQAHGTDRGAAHSGQHEGLGRHLRYPNRLNEQYDTFIATVDADDVAPTVAQQEVYTDLHRRLVEQLDEVEVAREH